MRARGRMLAWRISESVKVNNLSGPWPMLLYTWLIAHCDNLGRFHGEPGQVRWMVFPKQKVTDKQVETWLLELAGYGLILWYAVDGLRYVAIPAEVWDREQTLHANHSRTSNFPPPPDNVRSMYGGAPDNVPHEVEVEVEVESKTCPPDGERMNGVKKVDTLKAEWLQAFSEDFYPDYPRKVKPDAARRAWLAIKPWNQETCDAIFAGLGRWKAYWIERETAKEFIPHPSSFLNSGQWKEAP